MTVVSIEVPELTLDEKAELADEIASNHEDYPDRALDLLLRVIAAPGLDTDEARNLAWEDYTTAARLRDDVAAGIKDWSAVCPELRGPDRDESAVQVACERADDALRYLIGDAR